MSYRPGAHGINMLFIAGLFLGPIGFCLSDPSIPVETGRTVIVLSFLLGAFVVADWYHFYWSNSFSGLASAIGAGLALVAVSLGYARIVSGESWRSLVLLEGQELWSGHRYAARGYIAGLAVAAAALFSVPRLALIKALSGTALPKPNDA